jgi:hypothetical protein
MIISENKKAILKKAAMVLTPILIGLLVFLIMSNH